jgi:hypothetical protein
MRRINTETRQVEDPPLTEGAALPEPCFEGAEVYTHKAASTSFQAVRAIVSGTLLRAKPDAELPMGVHWYDARARVAAMRVALWLRVPRASFQALELELLRDGPADAQQVPDADLRSYHSSRTKWLKVGAAAVGGGILTAATAGLAAPAIVAGVGALVGLTGSAGTSSSSAQSL